MLQLTSCKVWQIFCLAVELSEEVIASLLAGVK